jgi:hypothetical protein
MYGVINLSGTGVSQSKVLSHKTCRIVLVLKVKGDIRPKRSYRGTHSHKINILLQSPLETFFRNHCLYKIISILIFGIISNETCVCFPYHSLDFI